MRPQHHSTRMAKILSSEIYMEFRKMVGGKLPLTFAGTPGGLLDTRVLTRAALGPRRHLRAPLVKDAGRIPPESSVSRVRCSNLPLVGSTCFFFLTSPEMRRWMSKCKIPTEAPQTRS